MKRFALLLVLVLLGGCAAGLPRPVAKFFGMETPRPDIVVAMYHIWYPGPKNMMEWQAYQDPSWLTRPVGFKEDRPVAFVPYLSNKLPYLAPKRGMLRPYGYNSADPEVIRTHCRWAKAARVNAFAIAAAHDDTWFMRDNLPMVAREMQKAGMKWFPILDEGTGPVQNTPDEAKRIAEWAIGLHDRYGKQGWFEPDGKPVFFIYAANRVTGGPVEQARFWRSVRDRIEHRVGNIIFIGNIEDNHVFDIVARYQMFDPNFWKGGDYTGVLKRLDTFWSEQSKKNLTFAPTVTPGFKAIWDEFYPWDEQHAWLEPNADFFRQQWLLAQSIDKHMTPEWYFITSWNEWWEGTSVEPTVQKGDIYLEIIRRRGH